MTICRSDRLPGGDAPLQAPDSRAGCLATPGSGLPLRRRETPLRPAILFRERAFRRPYETGNETNAYRDLS